MSGFEVIAGGVPDCQNAAVSVRASIVALESAMASSPDRIEPPEVRHIFAPGVYCRQMLIPAGVTIVGKIHRHAHVNMISTGRIAVVTEFGQEIIEGPKTWVSEPGTKRAVTALTDTLWTTVHPTEETDLAKIEEYVIAPTYETIGLMSPQCIEVAP